MRNTQAIVNEGVRCLLNNLGTVETEIFISHIIREPMDYTKWSAENLYNDLSLHELNQKAADYAKEHHFKPNERK
jgi:hypothetical protein